MSIGPKMYRSILLIWFTLSVNALVIGCIGTTFSYRATYVDRNIGQYNGSENMISCVDLSGDLNWSFTVDVPAGGYYYRYAYRSEGTGLIGSFRVTSGNDITFFIVDSDDFEKFENDKREWNKKFEKMAQKFGTLVEDIFFPSIDYMLKKYFEKPENIIQKGIRIVLRDKEKGLNEEIDIFVETASRIYIVEVKSHPAGSDVKEYKRKMKNILRLRPKFKEKEIIWIYGALNIPENVLKSLTKNKIFALVISGDILRILNYEALMGKEAEG